MPPVVVFDVNETLSDMSPLAARFEEVGAPPGLDRLWFASLLRDGFALAAAGSSRSFADVARAVLDALLRPVQLDRPVDDAVGHILGGFASLDVHPDVPDGVRALHGGGCRLVTLTNGGTEVARTLLGRAGLLDRFERLLSVDDAGAWKPVAVAYRHAAGVCGCDPADMVLVAVHPWDIHGAAAAGMRTAWVNRAGGPYPSCFHRPDVEVAAIGELTGHLLGGGAGAG